MKLELIKAGCQRHIKQLIHSPINNKKYLNIMHMQLILELNRM